MRMKKILSSVLALALVLSILPTGLLGITASASDECEHDWYEIEHGPVGVYECETEFYETYECGLCGETYTETWMGQHIFNDWEEWPYVVYNPSWDYDENICMIYFPRCGNYLNGEICGHVDYSLDSAYTTTHDFVDGVCDVCGYVQETVCEHDWNLYDTDYPPGGTCEDYCTNHYECLNCGETKSEETLIGHAYGSWEGMRYSIYCGTFGVEYNDAENICKYYFRKCSRYSVEEGDCGHVDYSLDTARTEPHYFEDGVCGVCGYEEVVEHVHNYSTVVTAPTCTAAGYTTYTCSGCGNSYTANETAALGHSYDGGVVTAPTTSAQGFTTYTCSVCGYSYKDNFTPAISAPTSGTSEYYTYTTADGKATITKFSTSYAGEVIIPSTLGGCPVTAIADKAFYGCSKITSVYIPDSVTTIGQNAFYKCTGMKSVRISPNIETISATAFAYCSGLLSVDVPEGVKALGNYAFYKCTALKDVTLPSTLTSMGHNAFGYDSGLESINIPDGITMIDYYTFFDCSSLKAIDIPDSVQSIGYAAFYNCNKLTSFHIPEGVKVIDEHALSFCSSLTSITIPSTVTELYMYAFNCCTNLETINIPAGVTSIGDMAFFECTSLKNVYYCGTAADWNKISIGIDNTWLTDAGVRYHNYAWVIDTPATCVPGVKHEECVYCDVSRGFDTVIEPITGHNYEWVIDKANNCGVSGTKHKECTVCDAKTSLNTTIPATGNHTYDNACDTSCNVCGNTRVPAAHVYTSICDASCNVCGAVRTSVHGINASSATNSTSYAFALNNGVYNSTNKSHSSTATYTITALYDHKIKIEYYTSTEKNYDILTIKHNSDTLVTASGSTSWKTIYIDLKAGDTVKITYRKDYSVHSYNDAVYFKYESYASTDKFEPTCEEAVICDVCGEVAKAALGHSYECGICTVCGKNSWSFTVENGEVTITGYDGTDTQITIPSAIGGVPVTAIGARAFSGNSALVSIVIPDSIKSIANNAFYGCTALTRIVIPDSVTSLGSNVFYGCSNLVSVTLPKGITSIGSYLFSDCKKLASIKIPDGVTSIAFSAFANCTALKTLNIPASVTSIASRAFYKCTGIESVSYCGTADDFAGITVGSENTYLTNAVSYTGHNYECVENKTATCFEDGYNKYECTICSKVDVRNFVKGEHNYVAVVTAPTYSAQGFTTHTCSGCGNSYVNTYTNATGTVNGVQNMKVTETDESIIVSWDAYPNATTYNFYVKNAAGETIITRALSSDRTSITLSWPRDIEWDENYVVGVRVKTTRWLTTVWKDAALKVGSRVVDVKTQSNGRNIYVTWKAYEGATQYRVYVYKKGEYPTAFTNVKVTTNSAIITNAIYAEIDYEIRVVATVGGVQMKTANALSVDARLDIFTPSTFVDRGITPTKVQLSWEQVRGADRYWVYLTPVNGGDTIIKEATGATGIAGLTPGTTYNVQVQARITDADGNTHYSGASPILGTITTTEWEDIEFTALASKSGAEISWKAPTNAYRYIIYRSTNGGGVFKKIATITDISVTSYTDTAARNGYKYAIVTELQAGEITVRSPLIKSAAIVKN